MSKDTYPAVITQK